MTEAKDYYTIDEVAEMVKRARGTIYNRIKLLHIQTQKFPQDKKTYVAASDVEKIKTVVEKPWMARQLSSDTEQAA